MTTRMIVYSALAGFVVSFFGRITFNPVLQAMTPVKMCVLGGDPHRTALVIALQNAVVYGVVGALAALVARIYRRQSGGSGSLPGGGEAR